MCLRPALLPFALLFCQPLAAAPQKEALPSPVAPAPVSPASRTAPIPAGSGTTTSAGKFVPAAPASGASAATPAAGASTAPPVTAAEAEKQLREALKVQDLGGGKYQLGRVKFDATTRTVSVPAKVNLSSGVIEYVLTTEAGKAHESMLTTTASPRDLHLACLLLGMKGAPVTGAPNAAMEVPAAQAVKISVTWETNGPPKSVPLAGLLQLKKGGNCCDGARMAEGPWHYTGSRFLPSGPFAAESEGSLISLIRDDDALVNNPDETRDSDELHLANPTALPPAGWPVTIVFQLPAKG